MITNEQRLARSTRLGSSDAPAILGLDPYTSAADVWLMKTQQADDFAGNANTERGNVLERAVLEWGMEQLGKTGFALSRLFIHPSDLLVANMDAISDDLTEGMEAKTTVLAEEWGAENTDEVPQKVLAQVHHQFINIPSMRVVWVPVLMPGYKRFDFRMYCVERNDALCGLIESEGLKFMREFVLPKVQPSDYRPSLEVLKRVRREPNKIVDVPDELVEMYRRDCDEESRITKQKEKSKSYLLAAIGDAEAGRFSGGLVTYYEIHRKGHEVAPCTYRSLKVKAAKALPQTEAKVLEHVA